MLTSPVEALRQLFLFEEGRLVSIDWPRPGLALDYLDR